ncbi:UNVERIFIED_CONTAM: hypothetical protein Sindi_1411400 [Sesamum indicum]
MVTILSFLKHTTHRQNPSRRNHIRQHLFDEYFQKLKCRPGGAINASNNSCTEEEAAMETEGGEEFTAEEEDMTLSINAF